MTWNVESNVARSVRLVALCVSAAACLFALVGPGCNSSSDAGATKVLTNACSLNSDCSSGLICALGKCRPQCVTAADCASGASCIDDGRNAVCQPAAEKNKPCSRPSDCPTPLACASDYRCRNLCLSDADCNVLGIKGRACASDAQSVNYCADPGEATGGKLTAVPPPGAPNGPVVEPGGGGSSSGDGGGSGSGSGSGSSSGSSSSSGSGSSGSSDAGTDSGDSSSGGGACGSSAPTSCDAGCFNTMTDKFNCGACGKKCLVKCSSGQCADPTALSTSNAHTCARLSDGTVECWGDNSKGQLGTGGTTNALAPVAVSGLSGVTAIAAGYLHSCAALSDGTAACLGYNASGELGNGTNTNSATPVAVLGLSGVRSIAAGGWYQGAHSCAMMSGGAAQCWGDNTNGELGNGTATALDGGAPTAVSGLTGAMAVVTGAGYSCALVSGGTVKCWGTATPGQNNLAPVSVPGLSGGVIAIAGGSNLGPWDGTFRGGDHACALLSDGTVKCWGDNGHGELGNGTASPSMTAVAVAGLNGATGIAASGSHSCAVLPGGQVGCWGDNSRGELGIGTMTAPDAGAPVIVSGLSGATAVIAGDRFSCALLLDRNVRCWGYNGSGQLGNGTINDSPTPVAVTW